MDINKLLRRGKDDEYFRRVVSDGAGCANDFHIFELLTPREKQTVKLGLALSLLDVVCGERKEGFCICDECDLCGEKE